MNFIFISPNYPHTYWQFCRRLKENGATVLGIGDAPYFGLSEELRETLTEYYYLDSLHDYEQVYRAVAFFAFKYGRIDWLESNNEFWMEQDAMLRSDFNIRSGPGLNAVAAWRRRSVMRAAFQRAELPTPRGRVVQTPEEAREFVAEIGGYPVVAKPDAAWGAAVRVDNDTELDAFFAERGEGSYIMEERLEGEICSYDTVTDSSGKPLFESMTLWPASVIELVHSDRDMGYFTCAAVPPQVRSMGRKALTALGVRRRFSHLRFLHVTKERPGSVPAGSWLALDANMRPADGYMTDVMDYAHSTDVYRIWADMVTEDRRVLPDSGGHHWCAYAGRRDHHPYRYSHAQILGEYGDRLALCERTDESIPRYMGDQMYALHAYSEEEARNFIAFVHA